MSAIPYATNCLETDSTPNRTTVTPTTLNKEAVLPGPDLIHEELGRRQHLMTILMTIEEKGMNEFGVRQFGGLLISLSMIFVGYLGLTGTVTTQSVLFAGIFVAVLSFSLGRQSSQIDSF